MSNQPTCRWLTASDLRVLRMITYTCVLCAALNTRTGYDFGPFLFGPHRRPVNKVMLVGTVVGIKQMRRHGQ